MSTPTPIPKPRTVKQPNRLPTNKVAAFALGGLAAAWLKLAVVSTWPGLADPALWDALPLLIGYAVAYHVEDVPNV